MMHRTVFVDHTSADEIDTLRMQEYARAKGFAVDLSTLKWRQSDSDSYVMALKIGENLVSTMRGEVIRDLALLEKKLECRWTFPVKLEGSVLLLSRAATLTTQRASGLNLVLRYWFLQLARRHGIRYIVGTFISGSPREKTLREMGYQLFENRLGWQQSTYRSLAPVQVAILDMDVNGEQALKHCLSKVGLGIHTFPLATDFPPLRYVSDL